jgi:hypothetical protein
MPLCLEEFKGLVVSDHKDSVPKELVLSFQKCFKYGNCLYLEYAVIHLHSSEFFQHETSGATCLPCHALAIHCADTRHRCIADNPDWVICRCVDQLKYRQFACNRLDVVEACFV